MDVHREEEEKDKPGQPIGILYVCTWSIEENENFFPIDAAYMYISLALLTVKRLDFPG
jgi:hypothetical protein